MNLATINHDDHSHDDSISFNTKIPGFKYLKNLEINNLLPIQNISDGVSSATLSTPIFYHVKTEKFAFILPESFFDNININEIIKSNWNTPQSIIIKDPIKPNIALLFNNISDIKNLSSDQKSAFNQFKNQYENYLLNLDNGKEVIFMAFKTEKSQTFEDHISTSLKDALANDCIGLTSQFEFCRAYKFNNRYYMVQQNGEINKERFFDIKPSSTHDMHYLVFPFTQEDWTMAHQLYSKIKSIKEYITSFFQMQKTSDVLDNPISDEYKKMKFLR